MFFSRRWMLCSGNELAAQPAYSITRGKNHPRFIVTRKEPSPVHRHVKRTVPASSNPRIRIAARDGKTEERVHLLDLLCALDHLQKDSILASFRHLIVRSDLHIRRLAAVRADDARTDEFAQKSPVAAFAFIQMICGPMSSLRNLQLQHLHS